jgi:hypothetical protein
MNKVIKASFFTPLFFLLSYDVNSSEKTPFDQPRNSCFLAIIIDESNHENPEKKLPGALTKGLYYITSNEFKNSNIPVLVSKSLFFNLFVRMKDVNYYNKESNRIFGDRYTVISDLTHIYDVPKTQFLLLLPSPQEIGSYFNLTHLVDKTELYKNEKEFQTWLGQELSINENDVAQKKIPFTINQLEKILKTKKTATEKDLPLWHIFINGHSSWEKEKNLVAGFTYENMQKIIQFFDSEVYTRIMYLETCYIGGSPKNILLKNPENNWLRELNYIIVLRSITDTPSIYRPEERKAFFYNILTFTDKGTGLNNFLKSISLMQSGTASYRGTATIPQLLLPRGLEFQTFNIDEKVLSLNKVLLQKYILERKQLIVDNSKRAVLIYSTSINIPLIVQTYEQRIPIAPEKTGWKNLPDICTLRIALENNQDTWAIKYKSILEPFNAFDINTVANYCPNPGIAYPEFISMIPGASAQYFTSITIQQKNEFIGLEGVFHFIRDAFLDVALKKDNRKFLIKSLTGFNDLSFILELIRLQKNVVNSSELEKVLEPFIGKKITLNNVYVEYKADFVKISFEFAGSLWSLSGKLTELSWEQIKKESLKNKQDFEKTIKSIPYQ